MNFLAHVYLSGTNPLVTIGNFVADGIAGKAYQNYPPEMQVGILLHRFIDSYTDSHWVFRKSTKLLHANYRHYSSVIVDIFYDHFLAKHWNTYSNIDLNTYTRVFYKDLQTHFELLPEKFKVLTPKLIAGNWLLNYAHLEGIQNVLNGMSKRTRFESKMNEATYELKQHYSIFESHFFEFFDDIKIQSYKQRILLENKYQI